MKVIAISVALLIGSVMSAHSQIAIKPAVGVNVTDFSQDPSTGETNGKVGYQLGGSVAFGKRFYIEPGLFFVKKSTEVINNANQAADITYDISGIRIPLTLGLNLMGDTKSLVGFRIFGGASAFMLTKIEDLDKDDFNTASFGVYAGAGVNVSLVFVEASYEWSLTDVQKDVSQIDIGQSRSVFINLGVRIPL